MATSSFQTDAGACDVSLEAGADLSAKQYYAVKRDATTGLCVLAEANEKALGIIQNAPESGEIAQVRVGGISLAKIEEGGTLTFGQYLTPTANGTLEVCDAAGESYIAKLLTVGAATGDLAEVVLAHGEVEGTDA